jgi:ATP-binding cassette subfamily B protein
MPWIAGQHVCEWLLNTTAGTITPIHSELRQGLASRGFHCWESVKLGFRTRGVQINFDKLESAPLPAILHWDQNHFVVVTDVSKKKVKIADPARGTMVYSKSEFENYWTTNATSHAGKVGTALLLEPTPEFYELEGEKEKRLTWSFVATYVYQSRSGLYQVFVSLFITFLLQLIFPFLTESMVDTGINTKNLHYITLILFAQLMLTASLTVIGFIRARLQTKISNKINLAVLSDFWIKLTRLPVSYYDTHQTGDILQRIGDNHTVQSFLTGQAFGTVFSILNFFVYTVLLVNYNLQLFLVFTAGNLLYFGWIQLFMRIQRKLNYAGFNISAKENNATLQLVQGMQEIRLNNAEHLKRWEWENLQVRAFQLGLKGLNYSQWQSAGALLLNQGKNIIISFMVANMVVSGELTFGAMLAVQYIMGQLSGPVSDFIGLAQGYQGAKIAMERLNEIYELDDEEPKDRTMLSYLPPSTTICFENVSFTYPGAGNDPVLKDIDLQIPEGKITAIVGVSGSGKTTLLKMLLKIYDQYQGEIKVGASNFKHYSPSFWRRQCGAVLQDGFVFSDTIARNIAVGDEHIDMERLMHSCHVANILSFIETLPNGFNTVLGADGVGISQGQRQRMLIARVVYKDPHYLFFDEATNSLDANNEKTIVENLNQFYKGKTVIIVAHRLSTVRDADKIVVLKEGRIIEEGSHQDLTRLKGSYYELVKNQLELGI